MQSKTSREGKCNYRFLLTAQSSLGTPLQCGPPPQGVVTLSKESTAVDGCLKMHIYMYVLMYIKLEMCGR